MSIASALFSNTIYKRLPTPPTIPHDVADQIKSAVFSVPNLTGLSEEQKDMVLDTYVEASRSVFYFWVGCIGLAWLLMWLIKDKGLQRKEERLETEQREDTQGRRGDEECGTATAPGDEEIPAGDEEIPARDKKTAARGVVIGGGKGDES